MKVFILTEGGSGIGFGHITRCIALYQAFEEKGYNPELVINADDSVLDFIKDSNYQRFNWLAEQKKLIGLVQDADLVIIDSYLAKKSLYDKISKITNGNLVIIDDYNRIEYPRGIVVNPSIYGDKLNYPNKEGVIYLLGRNYIILRKEFWKVQKKKINKEIKNVLITFGGMHEKDLTNKIASFLKERFEFGFNKVGNDSNKLSAKQMLELMLKTDICISGGGQTTYELARAGVPTIGICFAENQRLNLEYWHKEGFIEYVGWHSDKNLFKKLVQVVNKFMPHEERKRRNIIGKDCVDGRGADRIVTILTRAMINKTDKQKEIRLRPASKKDCYDLLKWRNHKEVRKWCFAGEKIKYKTHKEWFYKKLRDNSEKLYIAENEKGKKIGQVRLTTNKKRTACININLNPMFLHKGFGEEIIKKASEIFIDRNPDIKEVIAEIIDGNTASENAFKKAGFVFLRNNFKNEKKIAIFKFKRMES